MNVQVQKFLFHKNQDPRNEKKTSFQGNRKNGEKKRGWERRKESDKTKEKVSWNWDKITKTVWRDLGNRWDGIVKNSSHKGSKLYSWHEAGERLILIRQKKFDDSGDDSIMSVTERMK